MSHYESTAHRVPKKCIGWAKKTDCQETFPAVAKRERCLECQYKNNAQQKLEREKRQRRERADAKNADLGIAANGRQ